MTGPCAKCGYDATATIARAWSFFLERRTPSLNDRLANVGARRFLYRQERDVWAWHLRAMRLAHRIPIARHRRRATLVRTYTGRERERDKDNLVGGMKAIVDAMVSEGLLLDDASISAEIHYDQKRDARSGLLVELDELA